MYILQTIHFWGIFILPSFHFNVNMMHTYKSDRVWRYKSIAYTYLGKV